MLRFRLVDQTVPAMWRNVMADKLVAELPSGKVATARYAGAVDAG